MSVLTAFFARYGGLLWTGTVDTIYMTLVSTFFAYLIGIPLGVLLTITKRTGLLPAPRFNTVFGGIINIMRSIPFIILVLLLTPVTRFIVGTYIGSTAANVPLIISAFPFVARMVESSLEEVDHGVIEAAQSMGATNFQIVTRVLLVESIPSLLRGLSICVITVLGYTAITGAVGAGGLGQVAISYGLNRGQKDVMYAAILVLIALICIIQIIFALSTRRVDKRNR